jgi:tRNA A37 threonylcarbamoyladenosine modification protein TsaB
MLHKQEKIIIPLFYNDYTTTHIGLSVDGVLVAKKSILNKHASIQLITVFDELLSAHCMTIDDVSSFALYCGPAPFTTLRSIIATVNALAYATGKSIYAINGMYACIWLIMQRKKFKNGDALCVVHEAFCGDVYYAWYVVCDNETVPNFDTITINCLPRAQCVEQFRELSQHSFISTIYFAGNAFDDVLFFDNISHAIGVAYWQIQPVLSMPTMDDLHMILILSLQLTSCSPVSREQLVEPLYIKKAL